MPSPRVVMVCGDQVGWVMAGPAIRAVELGRVLAGAGHPVAVAAPVGSALDDPLLQLRPWAGGHDLRAAVDDADVVVAFAPVVADHMWLAELGCPLVVDAYDPGLLETLEGRRGQPVNAQRDWVAAAGRHLVDPLRVADVVLVASERQRLLALGILTACGRIGSRVVAEDPTLDDLVRVVPFGLPIDPPPVLDAPLRRPSGPFTADRFVALWGGGLYPWLDPVALVEAVAATRDTRISAAFLAGPHPTPAVGRMPLVDEARRRTEQLGLGDRVAFVAQWVPYAERGAWLRSADVGVSLHRAHAETELSFRTRVLDYVWAGLPVVCSGGDVLSEEVEAEDLGVVVVPGDVDGVAAALDRLAAADADERRARRDRLAGVAARRTWSKAAGPLLDVCAQPRLAADRRATEPQARGTVAALRRAVRMARSAGG